MQNIKKIILSSALVATVALTGCKTTEGNYDPVKTQQVKDALQPVVTGGIRRVIVANESSEVYFRAVGGVFCAMSSEGQFDPIQLVNAIDLATAGLQEKADPYVIDAKNLIVALYKINYGERFQSELPPGEWLKNVCDIICEGINQALIDAGKPGVK